MSPPNRRPLCSRSGGGHQEHQVLRVRAVGPPESSEEPGGLLHRRPRRRDQGLVPLQPQTLQAIQVPPPLNEVHLQRRGLDTCESFCCISEFFWSFWAKKASVLSDDTS